MKQGLYSVYDSKAQIYTQPFVSMNHGTAIRSFAATVNQEGHEFHRHASDYQLFHLAEWDSKNGNLEQHVPERVIGALEVLEIQEEDRSQLGLGIA